MGAFSKILIANRGEIACRIGRACRAMGIRSVAIFSDPDRHAPFVRQADEAAYIGPPVSAASFLAIDKIVTLAKELEVDAVHPGYGFLAENADFAQACVDGGIAFIGPTPEAIRRLGNKIEAKRLMAEAGVPTIPGFSAAELSEQEIADAALKLGFPVLIKAAAGGGGRGMRVVRAPDGLGQALQAARAEAKNAFKDDTLLVERFFARARHIEVQILGDAHGNVVHCFERECSIQRRHQKIIEEAPAVRVSDRTKALLHAAAVKAARAVAYQSAGTVEFVVNEAEEPFFLEVNTRLQVEHPVTEEITGLDLVRLQIEIAEGAPLPFAQRDLAVRGHAIEARVYAEDPRSGFLPSTGTLDVWEAAVVPGVRYESGVESGSEVSSHYDPLLAKVIATGANREEARRRLLLALSRLCVLGVRTNVSLLAGVLDHEEFVKGGAETSFLEAAGVIDGLTTADDHEAHRLHAVAAALWSQAARRRRAPVLPDLPSGWRNVRNMMQRATYHVGDETLDVQYRMGRHGCADIVVDGVASSVGLLEADERQIVFVKDGVRRAHRVVAAGTTVWVHSQLGTSELREVARLPEAEPAQAHGGCRAPVPGRVLAVFVEVGAKVTRGDVLVSLEAMKMEHRITAAKGAVVTAVRVRAGEQVEADSVLVELDEAT
jgi:propionyl-CoA carboxylase alpha chain